MKRVLDKNGNEGRKPPGFIARERVVERPDDGAVSYTQIRQPDGYPRTVWQGPFWRQEPHLFDRRQS